LRVFFSPSLMAREALARQGCPACGSPVSPARAIQCSARAIHLATAGGTGWQDAWGVRRQETASRPVTGLETQPTTGSQVSVVQGSPSSQGIGGLEQAPVAGSQTPATWH